jgi:hypothetical protein
VTNIYEQLAREVSEGVLDATSMAFGAKGMFLLPYYRTSWSFYRQNLSPRFVADFEGKYSMGASTTPTDVQVAAQHSVATVGSR